MQICVAELRERNGIICVVNLLICWGQSLSFQAAIFFQNIGADESKYSESSCPVGPMPEPYHDACKANPMPSHCFRHPFGSSCRYQDHLLLRSVRPWRLEPRLSTFSPFTQSIQTHLEHHGQSFCREK